MSAWKEYKKRLGSTRPWDVFNPNAQTTDEETASARYAECLKCEFMVSMTKQCKKCGCFMPIKVKLRDAECPIGKW